MNNFSDMLKYLRKREGLTQQELAKKLDISKSTVSMYENGNREPDFETLETIADFFNQKSTLLQHTLRVRNFQKQKWKKLKTSLNL